MTDAGLAMRSDLSRAQQDVGICTGLGDAGIARLRGELRALTDAVRAQDAGVGSAAVPAGR